MRAPSYMPLQKTIQQFLAIRSNKKQTTITLTVKLKVGISNFAFKIDQWYRHIFKIILLIYELLSRMARV
jgi:hypothetical protein